MYTYKEHYKAARSNYMSKEVGKYKDLYDLRLEQDIFEKTDEYLDLVRKIGEQVHAKISNKDNIVENPWATHLNGWRDIKELHSLFDIIMPEIERVVFKSNAQIEILHSYRNKPNVSADSSWLWHYDDCPNEFLKLIIYLTDVTERNGCFQYLQNEKGEFPMVPTRRVHPRHTGQPFYFKGKRIPADEVEKRIKEGFSIKNLTGGVGTYALVHPNIYHRATVPLENTQPRECLFLFIRPALVKRGSYSDGIHSILPERNVKMYSLN